MSTKAEIHSKLGKLISQGNEEYLQIMGVDLKKLRALEKKQDTVYRKLEQSLRKHYKKSGKEIAERHNRSLDRSQRIIARQIEYAIKSNHQLPQLDPYRYLCNCLYPHKADIRDTGEDVTYNPPSGDLTQGAINFNSSENSTQLFASADSPYSGEGAGTTVKAWFKFSFTPENDGTYCIRPIAQLNGYWMLWSGVQPGCQDYVSLPFAGFRININLRIEQLSDIIMTKTHEVIDSHFYDYSGAVGYDSEINNELNVEVDLVGGDQTIVNVECEVQVYSNNGTHVRIDMQTSPHFYFKVPMVKWGNPCPSMYIMHLSRP